LSRFDFAATAQKTLVAEIIDEAAAKKQVILKNYL
jgi:hypothetical protein